jgi:hypothetical protein
LELRPEGWPPSDSPPDGSSPPTVRIPSHGEPPVMLGRCVATGIKSTTLSRAVLAVSASGDGGGEAVVATASDKIRGPAAAAVRTGGEEWRAVEVGRSVVMQPGDQIALRYEPSNTPRWVYTLALVHPDATTGASGSPVCVPTAVMWAPPSASAPHASTAALPNEKRRRVDDAGSNSSSSGGGGGGGSGSGESGSFALPRPSPADKSAARPVVGFTGTRKGMTPQQLKAFESVLVTLDPREFHHGACVGADADAVRICRRACPRTAIVAWPGTSQHAPQQTEHKNLSVEARNVSDTVHPAQPFKKRNQQIVDAADRMIAAPIDRPFPPGSGTRMTTEMALKDGVPVTVVWPDGEAELLGRNATMTTSGHGNRTDSANAVDGATQDRGGGGAAGAAAETGGGGGGGSGRGGAPSFAAGAASGSSTGGGGGGGWTAALREYVTHPNKHADAIVHRDSECTVVKDKFPKARHHYLVLPNRYIRDLRSLRADDVPLLK